jgi:cyclase
MLTRRIIPCLDVKDGRTVKGIQFVQLRDAGDPVELAARYSDEGADELVFLDISATLEGRRTFLALVRRIARSIRIPFAVGGGIRSVDDILRALDAGADKVSLNTAVIARPELLSEAAEQAGSQSIIAAIDARRTESGWTVYTRSGTVPTRLDAVQWSAEAVRRGAGEILLTSMDQDGSRSGYDLYLLRAVAERVPVPVIASGGAGSSDHMVQALTEGKADAVLAASIFHDGEISIPSLKASLRSRNIPVRL